MRWHVPVDGVIGPVTLNAMVSVDDARFVAHFAAERLSYYTDLAGWKVMAAAGCAGSPAI